MLSGTTSAAVLTTAPTSAPKHPADWGDTYSSDGHPRTSIGDERSMCKRALNLIASFFVVAVVGALGFAAYAEDSSAPVRCGTRRPRESSREKGCRVAIKGLAFPTGNRIVAVGTTVVWTNFDGATHTGLVDRSHKLRLRQPARRRTFSKKFTSIGKYDYFCKIHSFIERLDHRGPALRRRLRQGWALRGSNPRPPACKEPERPVSRPLTCASSSR